jgi:hypothetical protein
MAPRSRFTQHLTQTIPEEVVHDDVMPVIDLATFSALVHTKEPLAQPVPVIIVQLNYMASYSVP